ncbi:hypothetical protein OIO90_005555 [Microbotryomycetes sp. JL221]|nr:hypothetical protein OIO90_005555 [Microbotryomycetes sp. JL221]
MPPRKQMNKEAESEQRIIESGGIDEFTLPRSIITRIAKSSVPAGTMLQKDVSTGLMHGSAVFVSYVTMLAHDIATQRGQKTISAAHVLDAVKQLGWEDQTQVMKALRAELTAFRNIAEAKKLGQPLPPPGPPTSLVKPYKEQAGAVPVATNSSRGRPRGKGKARAVDDEAEDESGAVDEGADQIEVEGDYEARDAQDSQVNENDEEPDVAMSVDVDNERDEADEQDQPEDDDAEAADEDADGAEEVADDGEEGDEEMPDDEVDLLNDVSGQAGDSEALGIEEENE